MVTRIDLINFGLCQVTNELPTASSDSPTGYFLHGDSIIFTNESDTFRIEQGITFGIHYLLEGIEEENAETFEVTIVHPVLTHPDTAIPYTTVTETKYSCIGETCFDYFKCNFTWETKPGTWVFQVAQSNRLLLEKAFTIYS